MSPSTFMKRRRTIIEEDNTYKGFVEHLALNNRIQYSEIPYQLRIQNKGLFYYAMRVARDNLRDAAQFVSVVEQFLLDIDEIEKQDDEVNVWLRRMAADTIYGAEDIFIGVEAFDKFVRQQKRAREWLFEN